MKHNHSFFRLLNRMIGCLFFLLVLCNWFCPKGTYSRLENRYLQKIPQLSIESLTNGSFMKQFEAYVNDHLFGRDFLVKKKANVEVLLGKKENNGVYFAQDGYFIEKPPAWDQKTLEQNLRSVQLLDSLERFRITLAVIPPAYEILQEKLPKHSYEPVIPKLNQMIRKGLKQTNILNADPTELLWEHRKESIYYKTDHHQASRGSCLVYEQLSSFLDYEPLGNESFHLIDISHDFLGTTYSKGLLSVKPDTITKYETKDQGSFQVDFPNENKHSDSLYFPEHLTEKDQYAFFLDGNHGLTIIQNSIQNGRRLVIFKDSYAHSLVPFLANHFETIHMIDLRYFQEDILQYLTENQIEDVLFCYSASSFLTDQTLQKVSVSVETSPFAQQQAYGRIEESEAVDDSYFNDAAFVGDSLTAGFQLYSNLPQADFLCSTGLSISGLDNTEAPGGGTILERLTQGDYKKIYIMLGINELIDPSHKEQFMKKYSDLIDTVKQAHPNSYLYIQSILPVSWNKNMEGPLNNEVIYDFNAALEQIAKEKKAFYLDVASAVSDENGFLPEESTTDGIHLNQEYYSKWLEYLKTHTVFDSSAAAAALTNQQPVISDYDVVKIASQLKENIAFTDQLGQISPAMLYQLHGINPDRMANACGWISGGATAEEIAVFETKKKKDSAYVKEQLEHYIKARKESFASYLPAEVPKLKQPFLFSKEKLIVLIIADDYGQAKELIQKVIK